MPDIKCISDVKSNFRAINAQRTLASKVQAKVKHIYLNVCTVARMLIILASYWIQYAAYSTEDN